VIGGAAGKYHAAEAALIAKVLSHRYRGVAGGAAVAYANRFNVSDDAAKRLFERAFAGDGNELMLDKLRALAGWLAPYQVPEHLRGRVIVRRLKLAVQTTRYVDPLQGASIYHSKRREAVS
jgi:hypothetical protein